VLRTSTPPNAPPHTCRVSTLDEFGGLVGRPTHYNTELPSKSVKQKSVKCTTVKFEGITGYTNLYKFKCILLRTIFLCTVYTSHVVDGWRRGRALLLFANSKSDNKTATHNIACTVCTHVYILYSCCFSNYDVRTTCDLRSGSLLCDPRGAQYRQQNKFLLRVKKTEQKTNNLFPLSCFYHILIA